MFPKGSPSEKTKAQALKINKLGQATQDGRDELGLTYPILPKLNRSPRQFFALWCFHGAAEVRSFGPGVEAPRHLKDCPVGGFISGWAPSGVVPLFWKSERIRALLWIVDWGSFSMSPEKGSYKPAMKASLKIKDRANSGASEGSINMGWSSKFVTIRVCQNSWFNRPELRCGVTEDDLERLFLSGFSNEKLLPEGSAISQPMVQFAGGKSAPGLNRRREASPGNIARSLVGQMLSPELPGSFFGGHKIGSALGHAQFAGSTPPMGPSSMIARTPPDDIAESAQTPTEVGCVRKS